jgi:thymidylate synthase
MQKMPINEIYQQMLEDIYINGFEIQPRGFKCKELMAYAVVLEDPCDRVITLKGFETNVKYAETEYKWYCSGSNRIDWHPLIKKIWEKYSDDGVTTNSAYGYRIFKSDQWLQCRTLLCFDNDTRRAVINIGLPRDKLAIKDQPCTLTMQFLIRNNKLHLIVSMRSNDAYLGFRNDVYCFTKLQERMANEIGISLGRYCHIVGSMHLYEHDYDKVKKLLKVKNDKSV